MVFYGCKNQAAEKETIAVEEASLESTAKWLTDDPAQPKRPENFKPFRYKYSIEELYENFSEDLMARAEQDRKAMAQVIDNGPYNATMNSLTTHEVPEWFEDAKLGIFLDWGPWSVPGFAPKGAEADTGGSYPDWYEFLMDHRYKDYHDEVWGADFRRDDFLPLLTGENFNAKEYMDLAEQAGAKYFVPFTRHHGGWAMWDSKYTKRNAVEMGPKRDIYRELTDAARQADIKLGLYFSISEWEYPVIIEGPLSQWDPTDHLAIFQDDLGQIPRANMVSFFPHIYDGKVSGKIPVRDYFGDYMMPLFKEAVDNYDPDLVWYDGGWGSPLDISRGKELTAYFYNQAAERKEVVANNRAGSSLTEEESKQIAEYFKAGEREKAIELYLSANRLGDYNTPEYSIGEMDPTKKWEVCRSISPAFGYNWQDDDESSLSSEELIEMFIGIVANNGNLLLVVSPDGTGYLPDIQKSRLIELGNWMDINAEAIHDTRPYKIQERDGKFFTSSKDGEHLYIHTLDWPGENLAIKASDLPNNISSIEMLGYDENLNFQVEDGLLNISIPENLQDEKQRPNKYAWVFKASMN